MLESCRMGPLGFEPQGAGGDVGGFSKYLCVRLSIFADTLLRRATTRHTALKMVKRRALEAGLPREIANHSVRGTGITEYLRNGGNLETAARISLPSEDWGISEDGVSD